MTMKRFLAILLMCGSAYGQVTNITVVADSSRAIRTNFTLGRAQVSDLSSASFAISNIAGLQGALDGKLATNGSAAGLSNFPTSLLATNGSAAGLSNFPANVLLTNSSSGSFPSFLLRTNGDGSALTNLPNANLSNAVGVLPISNGGSGATNQAGARTAFGLGSAATNDAASFQPASASLTNLTANNGGSLTNLAFSSVVGLGSAASNAASAFQPASANLTNLAANNAISLTNFPANVLVTNSTTSAFPSFLLRTNGDGSGLSNVSVDLTAVLPSYSGNDGKVLSVATGGTNVQWTAISNTVTDASTLTNFPSIILQTNSADASFPAFLLRTNSSLSSFPSGLLRTNGDASGLSNLPSGISFSENSIGPTQYDINIESTNVALGGSFVDWGIGMQSMSSVTNGSFGVNRSTIQAYGLLQSNSALTDFKINFGSPFSFGMYLGTSTTNTTLGNNRVYLGVATNYQTNNPTNVVIGWRIKNHTIYAAMHNGTNYTEPFSTNGVLNETISTYVWTFVKGDGNGSVSWYVNGSLLGTSTNGPTGQSAGPYLGISAHNDTGSNTPAVTLIRVLNFKANF